MIPSHCGFNSERRSAGSHDAMTVGLYTLGGGQFNCKYAPIHAHSTKINNIENVSQNLVGFFLPSM